MRRQACQILGVSEFATDEEIKQAYKNLVKEYHPDAGNQGNIEKYHNVTAAYEYLKSHPRGTNVVSASTKIIGQRSTQSSSFSYAKIRERDRLEKQHQKEKEQMKKEQEIVLKKKAEKQKKQQEEYEKAMEAIRAIQMAEALKAIIHANDEKNEEKTDDSDNR